MTQLHRQKNCCSSEELFLESLEEMREIYRRNQYPKKVVEAQIQRFIQNDKKPERTKPDITITLDYTSPKVESHMRFLLSKLKNVLPNFKVNLAFRSKKVTQLFSSFAKVKTETFDTANVIYKFQCTGRSCSSYIGQTGKPLIERVKEHNQYCHARGIYFHKKDCEIYKSKLESFLEENGNPIPNSRKYHDLEIDFLKSHFTVLEKNFATYKDRMDAEAYFIRSHRPRLNEQKQHNYFSLFQGQIFFQTSCACC